MRQAEAPGLGHAVLCAEKLVGEGPFAVILADDLLYSPTPVMKQLVNVFNHYHSSVVGVEAIARENSASYGVVDGREWEEDIFKLSGIVEKPAPEVAPSNLGVVGRYVLMPTIFNHLRALKPGAGGELQLTDALQSLLTEEQVLGVSLYGHAFRLRQQARLSQGHGGVRTSPPGGEGRVRGLFANASAGCVGGGGMKRRRNAAEVLL